jgi:hypothetical protein
MEEQRVWSPVLSNNTTPVNGTLFTDRSLYRPGQTVHVKGVLFQQHGEETQIIPNALYTLQLITGDDRTVAERQVITNDFGSFTTDFTLPKEGVNGNYMLVITNCGVRTVIRVEAYKRPTFFVETERPKGVYKLGDSIDIQGRVQTYIGAPLAMSVRYQFEGTAIRLLRGNTTSNFSVTGTVQTDENGNFTIPVYLDYDKERVSGYYFYTLTATATDDAGETQESVFSFGVGNTPVNLSLDIPATICREYPCLETVRASSYSGELISANIQVSLYKNGSSIPSFQANDTANHPLDFSLMFASLPSGSYRMVVSADNAEPTERYINLFSLHDTKIPTDDVLWTYDSGATFDETTPATLMLGTATKDCYIYYDVFVGTRKVESRTLQLSEEMIRLSFPYKAEYSEGFEVSLLVVKDMRVYAKQIRYTKKRKERLLHLHWDVLRDHLLPGQTETWTLSVYDGDNKPVDAEVLARMYDASLDAIWNRDQRFTYPLRRQYINVSWDYSESRLPVYSFAFRQRGKSPAQAAFDYFTVWMSYNQYVNSTLAMTRRVEMYYKDIEVRDEAQASALASPAFRTNFNETAFFYPQLRTDERGEVHVRFVVPESLTQWNVQAYAHTRDYRFGSLDTTVVTSKPLMLTAHLPRFVRRHDNVSFDALVVNRSEGVQEGVVTLMLFDPATDKTIHTATQPFRLESGADGGVHFAYTLTDEARTLACRMTAATDAFSDGEQHLLPLLSNTQTVTESVAMPVNGRETARFDLSTLFNHNSPTATDRSMRVEFTANPAWYAVQALTELAPLTTTDNTIACLAAYYANRLAQYIVQQKPRIAPLFDANMLDYRTELALQRLQELRRSDGRWPWYKGMDGNDNITRYVARTLARLSDLVGERLPLVVPDTLAASDIARWDTLSVFPSIKAAAEAATALYKAGHTASAQRIGERLKAAAVHSDELGMYYDKLRDPYLWSNLAEPTQVAVIELMHTLGDEATVEALKLWLLKRKQTRAWNSPVATVDAVYALLLRGNDWLDDDSDVQIRIGRQTFTTDTPDSLGLLSIAASVSDVRTLRKPTTATVVKRDAGAAWGAVYAEYTEQMSKLTARGEGLHIDKQ